jgi:hypothetical protein
VLSSPKGTAPTEESGPADDGELARPPLLGAVPDPGDPAWLPVHRLLDEPAAIGVLVRAAGPRRFGSDDWGLVVAQVAREAIAALVNAGVHAWAAQRRVVDLTAANVLLREGPAGIEAGLRRPDVAVLPTDPLLAAGPGPAAGAVEGVEGVGPVEVAEVAEVADDDKLFRRFLDRTLGDPVPIGALPGGPADRVAAVAALVATVRHTVRTGHRHLWGTAALAAAGTFTRLAAAGHTGADRDRARLLAARPDLARTIELVTVADPCDAAGGDVTFAVRRTCCLLLKLPAGRQCGTCSLRDRDACIAGVASWALDLRRP